MSTLLGLFLCVIAGGWVIALVFKLGAVSIIATLGALALGVLYGIVQAAINIPWDDDLVLFCSVYGVFGVVCLVSVGMKFQLKATDEHDVKRGP